MAVQEQTDHGTCSYLTFDVEPDSLEEDGVYCVTQQTLIKVELSFQNVFQKAIGPLTTPINFLPKYAQSDPGVLCKESSAFLIVDLTFHGQ